MSSFNTIVLSGGGIKGIITLGALQYAKDQFLLQNVNKYVGTSIGAIICYLLAIGYTPMELMIYLCTSKLDEFKFFDVLSLSQCKGAMHYNVIQEHLEKLTIDKIGKFITLGELKSKYNKTLICSTFNITESHIEYLTPDTHSDLPCLTAIKMSSNLPLIFDKFTYTGNQYIDGGVVELFPIRIADEEENGNIFGIFVHNQSKVNSSSLLEYAYDLMFLPMHELTNLILDNVSDRCTILNITDKSDIKTFGMSLTPQIKLNMFSKGYNKAKKYFDKQNNKSQMEI